MLFIGANVKLDSLDIKILGILQRDAEQQVAHIAEQIGLSATPCWRRIQRLKEAGVITGTVALLDPRKVNVAVTVFVSVRTSTHTQEWLDRFTATVDAIPEVVEFYRMSGDVDYLLRVVVPDIAAYDAVYKRLISGTNLHDVSSSFAMQELKQTTALPLGYI
ncbi:Lrp/AsnC family transcriptional regulator [Variovorax boronicumulans]|uniref:Lrp/AsnC family transcriptional regulator n=1 Tax=Variovorax boronicumulans TaxID=436515 RepID=UPI0024764B64|nr:Lrp/AsnC family transcriptional regulator [Variovorax boronicumulans]MDH6166493.1 Lrp/AsnC family transcriptional regulator [Variovorax boronicumulans]